MAGLLFLFTVFGFVLVAHWALKNDGLKADELGSGLLAMRAPGEGVKQKSVPKWKKAGVPERTNRVAAREKKSSANPRWQRNLLRDKTR
jgi:hypothetical protein